MYLAFKKSKKHDRRDLQQYFSTFLFLEYDESNTCSCRLIYRYPSANTCRRCVCIWYTCTMGECCHNFFHWCLQCGNMWPGFRQSILTQGPCWCVGFQMLASQVLWIRYALLSQHTTGVRWSHWKLCKVYYLYDPAGKSWLLESGVRLLEGKMKTSCTGPLVTNVCT